MRISGVVKIALIVVGSAAAALLLFYGLLIWLLSPGEFPEPDYTELLAQYKSTMGIWLPSRQPDFCEDTHGGFHGDGDTIIVMTLSEEEAQELDEDVETNAHWSQITCESNPVYDLCLDERIKHLRNGNYYCFYNKQSRSVSAFSGGMPNNFIYVQYDMERKVLYIQEFDS